MGKGKKSILFLWFPNWRYKLILTILPTLDSNMEYNILRLFERLIFKFSHMYELN